MDDLEASYEALERAIEAARLSAPPPRCAPSRLLERARELVPTPAEPLLLPALDVGPADGDRAGHGLLSHALFYIAALSACAAAPMCCLPRAALAVCEEPRRASALCFRVPCAARAE